MASWQSSGFGLEVPRWPSGNVSDMGPEGSELENRFPRRSCMGAVARYIIRSGQTSSRWCGEEVWRGECQLRHRPHHLTGFQN
ncbi:hypothetical protein AVEN_236392-1 [Araneus ventricosus]|uniref:Uncharacterized protein n=1 Tax=Araneus ventricosus TaxID=182803 RepID=A0A4Y2LUV9_ARAVE|nr:hypothetical protein AVEN_236392-1 [Araneus ventricosus]